MVTDLSLRDAYALAWLAGLQRHDRPQDAPAAPVRLDTPGRAPLVPLRPAGGDHARVPDEYVRPRYPIDTPPTWRAACSCGWTGPERYAPPIAGSDLTALDHRAHRG